MKMDVIGSLSHSICITGATFGARVSLQGCDSTTSLRTHDKIGVLLTFAFLVLFPLGTSGPQNTAARIGKNRASPQTVGNQVLKKRPSPPRTGPPIS